MQNVLENLKNVPLNYREINLIHLAMLSRINTIKKLIKSWEDYPDEHSGLLAKSYNEDLVLLQSLEQKFINL
jgi:hypothetical protein